MILVKNLKKLTFKINILMFVIIQIMKILIQIMTLCVSLRKLLNQAQEQKNLYKEYNFE